MNTVESNLNFDELAKKLRADNHVDSGLRKMEEKGDLESYKEAMEKGYTMLLRFSNVNDEFLETEKDGIIIKCPMSEFSGNKYIALEKEWEAMVTEIDESKNMVLISINKVKESNIVSKRDKEVEDLEKLISMKLRNKEKVVYPCRVIRVIQGKVGRFVLLSCLDTSCIVRVRFEDWSADVDEVITDELRGKFFDIEITERLQSRTNDHYWAGSRKSVVADPWERENVVQRFKKNDLITVKCTDVDAREGKNRWFGVSQGINGIKIMGDFADDKKLYVEPGKEYRCFIKKIVPEKRQFVVKPIAEIIMVGNGTDISFRNPVSI